MPKRSASSITMTVASGTSTPTSITVVATSTSMLARAEARPSPPPSRPPASGRAGARGAARRASPSAQALALLGRRAGLDALGPLDERADHVGPVPGGHLVAHPLPGRRSPRAAPRAQRVVTGVAARRQLVEHGHVEVAEDAPSPRCAGWAWPSSPAGRGRPRSGRRPRRRRAALVPQGGALLDPEAVLLVDDHHAERVEPDVVGQQGVGADHEVDRARARRPSCSSARSAAVRPVGEQRHRDRAVAARAGRGRRTDEARRAARGRPVKCCSASTSVGAMRAPWWPPWTAASRAATATTVLPDPTSPCRRRCMGSGPGQVGEDLGERPALRAGRARRGARPGSARRASLRVERARRRRGRRRVAAVTSSADTAWRMARASRSSAWRREHERQLQPEQLVEGQPAAGRRRARPSSSGRWMPRIASVRSTSSRRGAPARRAAGRRTPRRARRPRPPSGRAPSW